MTQSVNAIGYGTAEILELVPMGKTRYVSPRCASHLQRGTMSQTRANKHPSDSDETSNAIEERLWLIIDALCTMVSPLRPDGVVEFANQRWLDYTGLSLEEEIKEPTRVVHPEDLPRVIEKWLADLAAGGPSEDEMRLRRADGQYRWFLVRTAPLRNEQG